MHPTNKNSSMLLNLLSTPLVWALILYNELKILFRPETLIHAQPFENQKKKDFVDRAVKAEQRSLVWDRSSQQFTGDAEANRLLDRARREPWVL